MEAALPVGVVDLGHLQGSGPFIEDIGDFFDRTLVLECLGVPARERTGVAEALRCFRNEAKSQYDH